MAAMPEPQYGVDPQTMDPMQMPDGPPVDPSVDPNSPPADPMLAGPVAGAPVDEYDGLGEVEYREKVELCLLGAVESCAKAVEVGVGGESVQFVQAFGQAAASLAQAYEALTRSEMAEKKPAEGSQSPSDGPSATQGA